MEKYEKPGERLQSRVPTEAYREGWDRIFGQKKENQDANKKEKVDIPKHSGNSGTD